MKKNKLFQNEIYVKKSPLHGYGVFAGKTFKKGEKIEECYAIITKGGDKVLEDYYFDATKNKYALLTGFGSIYNHSDDPNADHEINVTKRRAIVIANQVIPKGKEIFISYGEEWFETRGFQPKQIRKKKISKKKVGKKK